MGAYVLFPENITPEERKDVEDRLKKLGYKSSCRGEVRSKAIGVCTYNPCVAEEAPNTYTYLNDRMADEHSPMSWTAYRIKCDNIQEFFDFLEGKIEKKRNFHH